MNTFLTIILDGLIQASWLFIVALGLTLVFGVLKILNIAHGGFYGWALFAAQPSPWPQRIKSSELGSC